jgi:glycosyltransferase involved in cell wall biosynthesis
LPHKDPAPFLSIILPAHNEEHRLPEALERVCAFLKQQPYRAEVLVVENGSQDRTLEVAQAYAGEHPDLRAIHLPDPGKGLAVRHGMLAAAGEYRFMCDVDLSMPIDEINRFLPPQLSGFDLAIGSREAPGAVRYNEPIHRHLTGRVYNTLIRLLALPDLHDTQCGFKCFRGPVADDLFGHQTLTGWSFDVEVLFIARQRQYRIVEIPIPWYFNPDSRVRLVHDSIHMGLDLLAIRQNARAGIYNHVAGA